MGHLAEAPPSLSGLTLAQNVSEDVYKFPSQLHLEQQPLQQVGIPIGDVGNPSFLAPASGSNFGSVFPPQEQVHVSGSDSLPPSLDLGFNLSSVEWDSLMEIPYSIFNSHLSDVSGFLSTEGVMPVPPGRTGSGMGSLQGAHGATRSGQESELPSREFTLDSFNRLQNEIMELNQLGATSSTNLP